MEKRLPQGGNGGSSATPKLAPSPWGKAGKGVFDDEKKTIINIDLVVN